MIHLFNEWYNDKVGQIVDGNEFYGQQEGERVLYIVRPHHTRKWVKGGFALGASLLLFLLVYFIHESTGFDPNQVLLFGVIVFLLSFFAQCWWIWFAADHAKAIITDRRFIRFEVAFPVFVNRRSLFWNEVLKVRGFAPNILFRFLKVGTLEVRPQMSEGETVSFAYVYYFEDLANYIDKVIYNSKNKPDELQQMRQFVPRPAGERF